MVTRCTRVESVLVAHARNGKLEVREVSAFLLALAKSKWKGCQRRNFYAARLVHALVKEMERFLASDTHPFPSSLEGSNLAPRGLKRRRRLDIDVVRSQTEQLVASKRFKSAAQAARFESIDYSEKVGYQHEHETVKRYLFNLEKTASRERQILVSFDETVLGSEATLFGFCQ
eukprot:6476503-Amphidinium_carterae.2